MNTISFALLLAGLSFALAVPGYFIWLKLPDRWKRRVPSQTAAVALALAFVLVGMAAPAFAQTTPTTPVIEMDLDPFFDSLNAYLPTFIAIFGIIGGIAAAIGFARFIINTIANTFTQGRMG